MTIKIVSVLSIELQKLMRLLVPEGGSIR